MMSWWRIFRQRRCPHLRLESFLIDIGRNKMWRCPDCRVYWTMVGTWPWLWGTSRRCQHPAEALEIEWGTHEVWCLECQTYLGHPSGGLPDWLRARLDERYERL